LTRNSTIEVGLGLVIFVIVGALGTIHPAIHLVPP
jgi:putative copper resistance protein D